MAIRRRCKYRNCNNGKRCLEHLQLDVKYRGIRFRMPVNDFAIPRMQPGKQRPIQSIEEARDWERLFIGEIKAGRDPRRRPSRLPQVATTLDTVAAFLDAYMERCIKPAGLRSLRSIRSRIVVLKEISASFRCHHSKIPTRSIASRASRSTRRTSRSRRFTASSKRCEQR